MLAKKTPKNQVTLPKGMQRADTVRSKIAETNLTEQDLANAVDWARQKPAAKTRRRSGIR